MPRFSDIPQFIGTIGLGTMTQPWVMIEDWLQHIEGSYGLDLDPDFQRAHVWTKEQQSAYVEYILRGGDTAKLLLFNSPAYGARGYRHQPGQLDDTVVIVDGKQRLEAVRAFLRNEIPAFGHLCNEYEDQPHVLKHAFLISVNVLLYRRDVLQWYLQINSTGVIHSPEELDKVRALLKECE